MAELVTRRAIATDCKEICRLFQEQVNSEDKQTPPSPETLKKDGFGNLFHVLVAEEQNGVTKPLIGYLFFHFIYPTWYGKSILITEVYVSPEFNEKSAAMQLFILLGKIAKEEECTKVQLAVKEKDKEKNEFLSLTTAVNLTTEGYCIYRLSKEQLMAL